MSSEKFDQAPQGRRKGLSRRQFLKLGLASGATLAVGSTIALGGERRSGVAFAEALAAPHTAPSHSRAAEVSRLQKFVDNLPIPGIYTSDSPDGVHYTVEMREIKQQLHASLPKTTVWGFGQEGGTASTPGNSFQVMQGQTIKVTWKNRLSDNIAAPHFLKIDPAILDPVIHGAQNNRKAVVHLHGGHVTAKADGHPEDVILPTEEDTYEYVIDQPAATLWYHDHALGNTRLNVMMGLAGFFLVRDAREAELAAAGYLPAWTPTALSPYEIPLAIQDRRLDEKGKLKYPSTFDDSFFGEVALLNGKAFPKLDVEPRRYRVRLLNGSNARNYQLRLVKAGTNQSFAFQQIGSDGGLLPAPATLFDITITPGERADTIIDFAQAGLNFGDEVILYNAARTVHMGQKEEYPLQELMKFRIVKPMSGEPNLNPMPAGFPLLQNAPVYAAPVRTRKWVLEDEFDPNIGDSMSLIKGGVNPDDHAFHQIVGDVKSGDTEIWEFVNKTEMIHPMHIHLVEFKVLSRTVNGANVGVDANETGAKDTVRVGSKETVRVIAKFVGQNAAKTPELFPFHCHLLEHEDHEMMRQFRLVY